jgi:ABC-type transporter Mla MlaB component
MLRISVHDSSRHSVILRLEGEIAAEWTTELAATCERVLSAGRRLTLDLGDVSLVDRPGLALLTALSHRAVEFVRCSPFRQEQLRQAATSHPTP